MNHLPVRLTTLRGNQQVTFDVFLQINDAMILYVRRGDTFESTRLQRLKNKRVKQVYILLEDQPEYLAYMENQIQTAYDMNSPQSMDERAQIIVAEQADNGQAAIKNPEDADIYKKTKEGVFRFVDFLINHDRAIKSILRHGNPHDDIAVHGVMVAAYAVHLGKKLEFEPRKMQMMALGALLHDIGLRDAPYAGKSVTLLTPEEKAEYDQHPQYGVNLARSQKHFDQLVLNIIDQHECCIDGTGTPPLRETDMDPATVVVATANAMDRLITFDKVPVYEAQKKMMVQRIGKHPLQQIQILNDLLKETHGF